MDRREALAGLLLALGAPAAMAGCDIGKALGGASTFCTREELALVSRLADAIIPTTDTPGALDVGVPAFLDAMMATWASEDTKTRQRAAFSAISARLAALGADNPIAALDAAAFSDWDGDGNEDYRALKSLIVQAYYSSEIGATQELQFELVPGRWRGDAPLADIGRTWAE